MRVRHALLIGTAALLAAILTASWLGGEVLPAPPSADLDNVTIEPALVAATASTTAALPTVADAAPSDRRRLGTAGRVIDLQGHPVADISVADDGAVLPVHSAVDGTFTFAGECRAPLRACPGPGWAAVTAPLLDLCLPPATNTLVVVPTARVAGRVCASDGSPIVGAQIGIDLELTLPSARPLRGLLLPGTPTASTDANGEFVLPQAPTGPGAWLVVTHAACRRWRVELDAAHSWWRIELPTGGPMLPVHGTVCSSNGVPLPHADVIHGAARTRSGDDGSFSLAIANDVAEPLWAVAEGHVPFRHAPTALDEHGQRPPMTIVLRPKAVLAGRLLDADRAPLAGWWIAPLADRGAGERRYAAPPARVAADGSFRFEALPADDCVLEAWQPHSQAVFRSAAMATSTEAVDLHVPAMTWPRELRGRVCGPDGRPRAGVRVGLVRPTAWAVDGALALQAPAMATDADGRFTLAAAPALALQVEADGVSTCRVALDLARLDQPLDLRLPTRRWIAFAALPTALHRARLTAADSQGRWLPWTTTRDGGVELRAATAYELDAMTATLVVRTNASEVGRIRLSH